MKFFPRPEDRWLIVLKSGINTYNRIREGFVMVVDPADANRITARQALAMQGGGRRD
jgi:hypothetical protein